MNFTYVFQKYGQDTKSVIRRFETLKKKLASTRNHINFLTNCKKRSLIPKGLRLSRKSGISIHQARLLNETELKLLNLEIASHRKSLHLLKESEISMTVDLYARLDYVDFHWILEKLDDIIANLKSKHQESLNNKFHNLQKNLAPAAYQPLEGGNIPTTNDIANNIIPPKEAVALNLSKVEVSEEALKLLNMGHNFGIDCDVHHTLDNLVRLDGIIFNDAELRSKTILEFDKHLSQIDKKPKELEIIEKLKRNKNIKISKADKGGKLVILDSEDYQGKLREHVSSNYQKLQKNPTNRLIASLRKYLKSELDWDSTAVDKLAPLHPKVPSIYGQPKLHKPNHPLRPIISQKGTCFSEIARHISKKLFKILGIPKSYVKNGSDFVDKVTKFNDNLQEYEDTKMISLDIVDMFPSIDSHKALDLLQEKLNTVSDSGFYIELGMSKSQCIYLITLILDNSYFIFENEFYLQSKGLAMGSSLSPLLANIYMEKMETEIQINFLDNIKDWWRYFDDTFVIWKGDEHQFDNFIQSVNNMDNAISFTVEQEQNNKITFLDVEVEKLETYSTRLYSKPTNASGLLHYNSCHPLSLKLNTAHQKLQRIDKLCSKSCDKTLAKRKLREELLQLCYPERCITRIFKRPLRNKGATSSTNSNTPNILKFTPLCYMSNPKSQTTFKHLLNRTTHRITWKQDNTILGQCKFLKPPTKSRKIKNAIYVIPCSCSNFYIGETKRFFETRLNEHKRYVRDNVSTSNIYNHINENPTHSICWDEAFVINVEPNNTLRKLKESVYIYLNRQKCFSDATMSINREWNWLLDKYKKKIKVYNFEFNVF